MKEVKRHIELLRRLSACGDAVDWCEQYQTLQECWDKCERGDWLLWLAGKYAGKPGSDARKPLVLAACQCARLALPYTQDATVELAIVTAEQWAHGDVTLDDVRNAADASAYAYAYAYAADASAYAYASAYAADVSAYAYASAEDASAYASTYAADAAYAAYASYDGEIRECILKQCADIVRQIYPVPPIKTKGD